MSGLSRPPQDVSTGSVDDEEEAQHDIAQIGIYVIKVCQIA